MPKFFEGNGILRCYNLFPRQFSNIDKMTEYLPTIKEMGFNAVWINPIQDSGGVLQGEKLTKRDKNNGVKAGNDVTNSLYAMKTDNHIDKRFSVAPSEPNDSVRDQKDNAAIKQFTDQAKIHGMVPMFDLVLNHLAANSPICQDDSKKHWFKGIHSDFKDANAFNYDNPHIRKEIIDQFWKPYIKKYFIDYGFEGVRVDAVGYLNAELRQTIYNYIYELCEEHKKPKPVILDEALMSNKLFADVASDLRLNEQGPSHITSGAYYATRDESTGMPLWTKEENGEKMTVIFENKDKKEKENAKGGCINFSGNHDHRSLAMNIIFEMAKQRIITDPIPRMNLLYERIKYEIKDGKPVVDEGKESTFLYPYEKDIINQIKSGNMEVILDFQMRMRDKVAMAAFTGSGGWYALCGDEYGDISTKPVFTRINGTDMNPQLEHKIFSNAANKQIVDDTLKEMAIDDIKNDTISDDDQKKLSHNGLSGAYTDLTGDPVLQNRLLTAYIDNIKNQINCIDPKRCKEFQRKLEEKNIIISFNENDYHANQSTASNQWNGIDPQMKHFMREVNALLEKLPEPKMGFWCEIIRLKSEPNLFIAVRKNGFGFDSQTDIVIMNLNSNKPVVFGKTQLYELACEFQLRTVQEKDRIMGNHNFDSAYNCVNNCQRIHCDPSVKPTAELTEKLNPAVSSQRTGEVSPILSAEASSALHSRGLFAHSSSHSIDPTAMRNHTEDSSSSISPQSGESDPQTTPQVGTTPTLIKGSGTS